MQNISACIFLLALTLIGGCSSRPHVVRQTDDVPISGINKIYVVSHGWHTGLVLPAKDIQARLPKLKERFGNAPFIEFGWGDKGFYQANEITTGLTLRAMFWSSGSVIHSVEVTGDVERFFPGSEVRQLCLSDASLASMIVFVAGSFAKNPQGEIVALKDGVYGNSQFYEGIGEYHMFNTCNKWTAKALSSAGMDISPVFKLTAGSIMSHIQSQAIACPEPVITSGEPVPAIYFTRQPG
jgi:uncharacterized protein (TIGR02117 family)